MRALVVDDAKAVRSLLRKMLEEAGFAVTEAADGREGLARLHELGRPDVLLVDWNMPVMDGLEFLRAVRADPRFASVPAMMVTTETEQDRVAEALAAGANEYIMKPFPKEALCEKLTLLGVLPEAASPGGRPRALVVDDSRAIRLLVRNFLEKAGWDVLEADSAAEGLRRLAELGPTDVGLVDMFLPDMNGLDFLKAARAASPGPRLILTTAQRDPGLGDAARAAGAAGFLAKPFTRESLLATFQETPLPPR